MKALREEWFDIPYVRNKVVELKNALGYSSFESLPYEPFRQLSVYATNVISTNNKMVYDIYT